MEALTKTSSSEEIKAYFNAILKLQSASEEFPINLDEVWMLVYSERRAAVRALNQNFIENEDYYPVHRNVQRSNNGKFSNENQVDYFLSLSCLEYFIARKVRPVFEVYRQVFHKVSKAPQKQLPSNYVEALEELLQSEKEKQTLLLENSSLVKENEANQPKVEFANSVMQSDDCISIAEMAQILKQNKLAKMGQNKLFDWMRCSDYIISRGARRNLPSQKSINLGIMRIAESVLSDSKEVIINRKAVITPQGQAYFIDLFRKLSGKEYRLFSR